MSEKRPPKGDSGLPDFPYLAPTPDPFEGVTLPDDLEAAPITELDILREAFRDRASREASRHSSVTDIGYYTCLAFETRAQCEAFLDAIGVLGKYDAVIDGRIIAAKMGISLPEGDYKGRLAQPDPKLAKLVDDPE